MVSAVRCLVMVLDGWVSALVRDDGLGCPVSALVLDDGVGCPVSVLALVMVSATRCLRSLGYWCWLSGVCARPRRWCWLSGVCTRSIDGLDYPVSVLALVMVLDGWVPALVLGDGLGCPVSALALGMVSVVRGLVAVETAQCLRALDDGTGRMDVCPRSSDGLGCPVSVLVLCASCGWMGV